MSRILTWRCALCAAVVLLAASSQSRAGYPHRGWYGHDMVPYVPDASGYVVVAPSHPGPYHVRVPSHQHGLYDYHGRWSAHRIEPTNYPWGWFGAKNHSWGAVQHSYKGDRTDWSFRNGP